VAAAAAAARARARGSDTIDARDARLGRGRPACMAAANKAKA
jgi:hypothetical protein